ncbi:unnamed protein product [Haemonchus placei]|uniref:DUF4766 domain-containing protein n=1 Tax=Haemonchus placei TaxID=6290 RepID=A0A0N4VT48_HAEPC|nr:unnamed protein product [Haemonchus placei]
MNLVVTTLLAIAAAVSAFPDLGSPNLQANAGMMEGMPGVVREHLMMGPGPVVVKTERFSGGMEGVGPMTVSGGAAWSSSSGPVVVKSQSSVQEMGPMTVSGGATWSGSSEHWSGSTEHLNLGPGPVVVKSQGMQGVGPLTFSGGAAWGSSSEHFEQGLGSVGVQSQGGMQGAGSAAGGAISGGATWSGSSQQINEGPGPVVSEGQGVSVYLNRRF